MKDFILFRKLSFLLLLFAFLSVKGQKAFNHFTIENGLPNNHVSSILQDKNKLVWISTYDGLAQFNGTTFRIFKNISGDSTSLPDNYTTCLYYDKFGILWVGTSKCGVSLYNTKKNIFSTLVDKTNPANKLINSYVFNITEDNIGNVWIASYYGLSKYERETGAIEKFSSFFNRDSLIKLILTRKKLFPETLSKIISTIDPQKSIIYKQDLENSCVNTYGYDISQKIIETITSCLATSMTNCLLDDQLRTILFSPDSSIWIGYSKNAFSHYNLKTKQFSHYLYNATSVNGPSSINTAAFYSCRNELYIGYENGIVDILNIKTGKFKKFLEPPLLHHITRMCKVNEDKFLVASQWNLLSVSSINKTYTQIKSPLNTGSNNTEFPAACVFSDYQNNIWVGTIMEGVYLLYQPKGFNVIGNNYGLTEKYVSSLIQDVSGGYWVGYYSGGMDKLSPLKKMEKYFDPKSTKTGAFAKESVLSIFQDTERTLWVGNYNSGLQRYLPETDNFISYKNNPNDTNSLSGNDVRKIVEDKKGNLWLATNGGGLCVFNKHTKKFKTFRTNLGKWKTHLPSDWLNDITFSNDGLLWIATTDGFSVYDSLRNTFKSFRSENSLLPHNFTRTIFVDNHNNVWVGAKNGLLFYNLQTNKQYIINQSNDIPSYEINSIIQDKNKKFWIGTGNGLFSFQAYYDNNFDSAKMLQSIANYDVFDGLPSNEFMDKAVLVDKNGMLMFGTKNGIASFYPDSINHNNYKPSILFTNLKLFNKSVAPNKPIGERIILKTPLYLTDTLFLNYEENDFTIEFVALNFIQSHKNRYKYILEGFEHAWQDIGDKHEVTFTNLKPGTYKLIVKASNNDGLWNNTGRTLVIIIKPPFWYTLWFMAIIVLITILLISALYYFRMSSIRSMNERLKELVEIRTSEIEEKNKLLVEQAEEMNVTNNILEERQQKIIEQAEELTLQTDELKQLNATKDKLFSILAHDLKGPFNAILGFSDLLMKNIDRYSKEKIFSHVQNLHDASHLTYDLLENLLQWSRAQRGVIEFEPENITLSSFVENGLKILQQQANRKEIEIETEFIGEETIVFADPNMLNTILRNLVANAIKYSYKNSKVKILIHYKETEVVIAVVDNGVGISSEVLGKLFKIGEHTTKQGTSGEKGTGLGLLLCLDFITRHEGKIWVQNNDILGSSFFISLPKK